MDMFCEDDEDMLLVEEEPSRTRVKDLTYEQVVKDLILEEKQYLRDTNMIIKVFREPFVKLFPKSQVRNSFTKLPLECYVNCPEYKKVFSCDCPVFMLDSFSIKGSETTVSSDMMMIVFVEPFIKLFPTSQMGRVQARILLPDSVFRMLFKWYG